MKTRLFDKNSILYPVVKQKIINLCETLKQNKLNCWIGFNSYGVKVTRLDEKTTINIKGGYGTSQQLVFFDFIIPFLKDTVVKTLDETLETCRVRGLRPEEPYIRETAMLLNGYLIDPIYSYMAQIDRRIRSKGDLKSIKLRPVIDEIAEMEKFTDKCKDEIIAGLKEQIPDDKAADNKGGQDELKHPIIGKEPSKEANEAYKIYYATGQTQAEVAKIMSKQYRRVFTQSNVSRHIKQVKKWRGDNGLLDEKTTEKPKMIPTDPNSLESGKRTDGKITGDPRNRAKFKQDDNE